MAEGPLPTGSVPGAPGDRGPGPDRRWPAWRPSGSAIELPDGRWCARHLLVRLHAASRSRRRRHVEPASIADFVRFLACWQHVAAGTRAEGRSGLLAVIEQLQGLEVAAGEWERHVLPARVAGYDPRWLDELCLAGEVAWGRLTPGPEPEPEGGARGRRIRTAGRRRSPTAGHRGSATPSSATPLAIVTRARPGLDAGRGPGRIGAGGRAGRRGRRPTCWPCCGPGGACFRSELARRVRAAATPRSTRDSGTWWRGASSPPTPSPRCAPCSRPGAGDRRGSEPGRARRRRPRPRSRALVGQRRRRGPVVAAARARRRRRGPGGPAVAPAARGAGRGGGLAAAGPLGSGGLGALVPRVLPRPLA